MSSHRSKTRRLDSRRCRLEGRSTSEPELQGKLHPAHRISDTPDFSVAAAVRRKLVRGREADAARIVEVRSVEQIERFPTELDVVFLFEGEVLKQRVIHVALARTAELADTGAAHVTQIRPRRNLAGHALE